MNLDELLQKNEITPHNLANNKSFCFTTSYLTAPLVSGFLNKEIKHNYKIYKSETSLCSELLKTDQTDFGLISTIDYEMGRGNWLIVPKIAISCKKNSFWATLFMKEGTKTLKKIAVDRHASNEIALLKIIMQEKYEIEPEFILAEPQIDDMLKDNDAALLIGENALMNLDRYPTHIDICEEWYDMSGLPFVISFWAGHELSLNAADVALINQAKIHGEFNLNKIIKQYAVDHNIEKVINTDSYKELFSFDFEEDQIAGLNEFFQYAFYLGIIDNIPDLHFFD